MEVIWVTILSKVANEDKNARLIEEPTLEIGEVNETFGARPETTIEMTRVEELKLSPAEPSFALPQKVLGACWPLLVMWPVLYTGYQVELSLGIVSK